jgi:hypothetical protein
MPNTQSSEGQSMNTTLEFPYKPPLWASVAGISLFLVGIVFMASMALNNDEGLIINGIITLGTDGATVFYWGVAVVAFFPLFMSVNALRRSLQKKRCIVLSEKDVTIPSTTSGTTVVLPLNYITGLAMDKRTLFVSLGTNQIMISRGHFADNASFELFLSHLKLAIGAGASASERG